MKPILKNQVLNHYPIEKNPLNTKYEPLFLTEKKNFLKIEQMEEIAT